MARLKLDRLEATTTLQDLAALPGNRFEALKGNRKGQYSIRINDQWRVCFQWPKGSPGPVNVEIVDNGYPFDARRVHEPKNAQPAPQRLRWPDRSVCR